MTSISKAYVAIADTAVDADSPLDQALMEGLRDDIVHLREWLGASYTAGSVQDHDHDGSNSALIEVGSNYLRNGSFEDGAAGWTFTDYTGGSHAVSTANQNDGAQSIEFTSTVLANGGGYAISSAYLQVSGDEARALGFSIMASAANISSALEVIWYDKDQLQISTSTVLSYADTPTAWTRQRLGCVAPTAARYMRLQITGGVPATGSGTGTVRFDGISLTAAGTGLMKVISGNVSSVASLDLVLTDFAAYPNKRLRLTNWVPATDVTQLLGRLSTNGGVSFDSGANNYGYAFDGHNTAGTTFKSQGAATSLVFNIASVGNLSNEGISGEIDFYGMDNAAHYTQAEFRTVQIDNTGAFAFSHGTNGRSAAQDTDAVQLRFSSGNAASGGYDVYIWI